jgi:hypothetical protein
MSPVTEIATLFLKPGIDVEDPSSPAYTIAQETFSTISSQPGYQRAYWGRQLEDESILQLFISALFNIPIPLFIFTTLPYRNAKVK